LLTHPGNTVQLEITLLGAAVPTGTYVLGIQVRQPLRLTFGRFNAGQPVDLPAGVWVYVGSAMSQQVNLARRLVRHASRSGSQPAHSIRPLLTHLLDVHPPKQKSRHWHVDYLLDEPAADLCRVIALHSPQRWEAAVVDLCAPFTQVIAPGLGASDARGSTHLRYFTGDAGDWAGLVEKMRELD
jgi:Uri superfamily endonuclease